MKNSEIARQRLLNQHAIDTVQLSEARNTLLVQGVPEVVLDVWHGKFASSRLRSAWAKPDFRIAEKNSVPGLAGLIPIFEQNGEAVVGYLARQFVRFYYEVAAWAMTQSKC